MGYTKFIMPEEDLDEIIGMRKALNISYEELGRYLGVSEQVLINVEYKRRLPKAMYLAIKQIFKQYMEENNIRIKKVTKTVTVTEYVIEAD